MPQNLGSWSLLALPVLAAVPAVAEASGAPPHDYKADAFCLRTGAHLYTEYHLERWEDGRHVASQVTYTRPTGEPIVRKAISYAEELQAPSFQSEDLRDGYREGGRTSIGYSRALQPAAARRQRAHQGVFSP